MLYVLELVLIGKQELRRKESSCFTIWFIARENRRFEMILIVLDRLVIYSVLIKEKYNH